MKKLIIILFAVTLQITVNAQSKRAANWNFLGGGYFNFADDTIAVSIGNYGVSEQGSTISDTSGNLLFYVLSSKIINSQHNIMPNGQDLLGNASACNGSIIIPKPNNDSIYYIFQVGKPADVTTETYAELYYHIVNMNIDSGRGDVIVKNTLMLDSVGERLTAVYHSNGIDVWLMTHKYTDDSYYAYLITENGISEPVITKIGYEYTSKGNTIGQMKFSPNGKLLVAAIPNILGDDRIDIFQFNNETGILSDYIYTNCSMTPYGVEFSPDNTKIYSSEGGWIVQYDLKYYNQDSIRNSRKDVGSSISIKGLQLGIDKKLYVTRNGSGTIARINKPNELVDSCDFVYDAIYLEGRTCGYVFPNFICSYFDFDFGVSVPKLKQEQIAIYPNPASNVFTITNENLKIGNKIEIFNLQGQKILTKELNSQTQTIDISKIPTGIYIYKIGKESGKLVKM